MTYVLDRDDDELMNAAVSAYYERGLGMRYHSHSQSGVEEVNDLRYVVLRNGSDVRACYRVKPDGYLRGLKRWPKEFEEG